MSRLWGKPEQRSITSVPWIAGGPRRQEVSQERALHLNPVFAAVRHIVDYGSTLPLKGYRTDGDARQSMGLPQLFAALKSSGQLVSWLGSGLASVAARGNAVGMITSTDGFGFPTNVVWVSMDRVYVDDSSGVGNWYIDGRPVSRLDIVHVPWITMPGRTLALSPIEYYAETVNAGLDAQGYGSDWFRGGGFPPAVFKNTQMTLPDGAADKIKARLRAAMRRKEPLVTGNDWEFTPITIPPEQAQFIETQKLTANQVAAIYGLDPTEIGGEAANSLTYSTEELREIRRAADMEPYLSRFEHAFQSWLPERQYVKFNVDAKIRADLKTRWEVNVMRLNAGAANVDEIRAQEDQPPLPDGQGQTYGPAAPAQAPAPEQPSPDTPPRLSAVRTGTERKLPHE